jgi:anti-anti-sigma factor
MQVNTHILGPVAVIEVVGRFDFSAHKAFRNAVREALEQSAVQQLDINLRAVKYLDSSALGMLLLSRENAHAIGKTIVLNKVSDQARATLDVVNFHRLFDYR